MKEQFIDPCPKELAIHLSGRAPETLVQIARIANQYLEAHGKHLFSSLSKKLQVQPKVDETKNQQDDSTTVVCSSVMLLATSLLTAHLWLRNVSCVASKGMKLEIAAQVNRSEEEKIEMVSLCSVGR